MLKRIWRIISRTVLIGAVVVAFLLAVELVRVYVTLHALHPWAGYGFAIVLAGLLLWMVARLMGGWRWRPRPLKCPDVAPLDEADSRDLRRYGKYLGKYLSRLAGNESLSDEQCQDAAEAAEALAEGVRQCGDRDELAQILRTAEAERIEPLLGVLDELAEREVGDCVRDVMVAVAFTPWPLLDALIVLQRNGSMVSRITHIYNSRPALREQLSILADTVRIVATIKLANMMRKIFDKVAQDVPVVGRVLEALTQAVGAGVLTGHAAKHRCRAFRGWSRQEAADHLGARLGNFLADCGRIATEIVLGPFGKLYRTSADALASFVEAFKAAIETVGSIAETFIRKPVAAGGRSVVRRVKRTARSLFRRRK